MMTFSIGEVARRVGIRPSALRYYEEIGLLPEPKRVSGKRQFDAQIFQQLAQIQIAKQVGFSLEEILLLMQNTTEPATFPANWEAAARRKLRELDDLITNAQQMKAQLEESLSCYCGQLSNCDVVESKAGQFLISEPG